MVYAYACIWLQKKAKKRLFIQGHQIIKGRPYTTSQIFPIFWQLPSPCHHFYMSICHQFLVMSAPAIPSKDFIYSSRLVRRSVKNATTVKFMFSKKATKIDEIFTVDLTLPERIYSQVPIKRVGPNKRVGRIFWANFIKK